MDSRFDYSAGHPALALSGSKLDELELLVGGLYAPADGYCLPGETPDGWPAPFSLAIPRAIARSAVDRGSLLLTDPDGTPLVHMSVTASASHAADSELENVCGTLTEIRSAEHPPARDIRITRPLTRPGAGHNGKIAALFGTMPRAHEVAQAVNAAKEENLELWLVAVGGPQVHGSYTVSCIVEELHKVSLQVPHSRLGLLVIPTYDPCLGLAPDTFHSTILANLRVERILDFSTPTGATGRTDPSPEAGTPRPGTVVFLTGLSGSGKSTVARALAERLQAESGGPVSLLDGDDVRRILSPTLGFSMEERNANIQRLGWVAALVSSAGGTAICAPIAPFEVARQAVREMAERVGSYVLVHVSTPLSVCEERDRKGLYAQARRGEITDFTGIDSPYEHPKDADLHLDTSIMSVQEAVDRICRIVLREARSVPGLDLPSAISSGFLGVQPAR